MVNLRDLSYRSGCNFFAIFLRTPTPSVTTFTHTLICCAILLVVARHFAPTTFMHLHTYFHSPIKSKMQRNGGFTEGVIFSTFSTLVAKKSKSRTRLRQLLSWCGHDFDGCMLFDE